MRTFPFLPVLALTVFSLSFSGALATEKQIQELESEIAEIRGKMDSLASETGNLQQLLANIESAEKELAAIKEELPLKEKSVADKEFLLGAYQTAFRVVTRFTPGENLGAIVLRNGETTEPSSFVSAAKGAILVQGATGSRSISFDLLPDTFSSKILLPPRTTAPSQTLAGILSTKPESIKSAAEKSATVAAASSGGAAVTPASSSSTQVSTGESVPDYDAIRKRNEARQRQIAELKLSFSALFTQKKLAREAKANAEKVFREAKIKKSQSEISSTLKMHDDKIAQIESAESELRQQIARLQSQME